MGQSMDPSRTLGHTRGRDLCPRRTGEPGALADERASTETRVRESDDSRWSRSGANRRIRPRSVDFERFRIDSHTRQPMVRPRANIGAVGTVRGVAVRIERAVQSTPRRLSANRGGSADIRSRGPTPDALIAPQAAMRDAPWRAAAQDRSVPSTANCARYGTARTRGPPRPPPASPPKPLRRASACSPAGPQSPPGRGRLRPALAARPPRTGTLVPSRRSEGLERVQGGSRLVFMRRRLRWRLNNAESDQKQFGPRSIAGRHGVRVVLQALAGGGMH